jgi:hypothetical protein
MTFERAVQRLSNPERAGRITQVIHWSQLRALLGD